MDVNKISIYRNFLINNLQKLWNRKTPALIILIYIFSISCETDPYGAQWVDEGNLTIGQYLDLKQEDFSKSHKLFNKGNMLNTLYAYNPYSEGYTLFLPTNEAIDNFINDNPNYETFDEMLTDTGFVNTITRYHTINNEVHTNYFPYGALNERTLTGERLVFNFYTDGDHQLIKVNNLAPIIKPNIKTTNGYIHVISEIIQKVDYSGFDWLQDHDDYTIISKAMELTGIKNSIKFNNYTIVAEPDSIFQRNGITNIDDLINLVAPPGMAYSSRTKAFYQYAAYHILYGEYFLNDFQWGSNTIWTLGDKALSIYIGSDIKINPGVDTLRTIISETGDTTYIDHIGVIWEGCNIKTKSGPVHSISEMLMAEPLPH